jgi:nicotinate-nucleotide adenylyltransferase
MTNEKIILFGGTFDPIHNGHIEVANCATDKINASKFIFVPARRSPLKSKQPVAADTDRIAMLQLAIEGRKNFEFSNAEMNRAEPSYTIDTIRQLREKFGENCEFYWLIGADMLNDLPLWHKINDLLDECNICVMNRGGYQKPDFDTLRGRLNPKHIADLKKNMLDTPLIEISSTEIRKRIAEGQDVSQLLPPAGLDYIKRRKLYIPTD